MDVVVVGIGIIVLSYLFGFHLDQSDTWLLHGTVPGTYY